MRIATWNVEWASGRRLPQVRERLAQAAADVLVVTEGSAPVVPPGYDTVDAGADWGYRVTQPQRRKVLLASRLPMVDVTTTTPDGMPGGRLVSATIHHSTAAVRIHGVCIPWRDAHVRTGRRDATAWSEHASYLEGLRSVLASDDAALPRIVIGDFNQRVPARRQPAWIYELLLDTLTDLQLVTSGTLPGLAQPGVNHAAISKDLAAINVQGFDRHSADARPLSDHDGVIIDIDRTRIP